MLADFITPQGIRVELILLPIWLKSERNLINLYRDSTRLFFVERNLVPTVCEYDRRGSVNAYYKLIWVLNF